MRSTKITLLNSSILTSYGEFRYTPLTLTEARHLIKESDQVQSAIGHASTAAMISDLFEFPVNLNRMEYRQQAGEAALIFKLKVRPPEGKILNLDEIEDIGYQLGLLKRLQKGDCL